MMMVVERDTLPTGNVVVEIGDGYGGGLGRYGARVESTVVGVFNRGIVVVAMRWFGGSYGVQCGEGVMVGRVPGGVLGSVNCCDWFEGGSVVRMVASVFGWRLREIKSVRCLA
ncbi:unnamed protein product [Dovyalis caffra]|uniref:Uncharacterized protein n=1 Tax=Dovyalis caffra TaxID=77055 RepID=A0AAV1SSS7_9ROSI|nr:unnamed protein product [Dovyalis caffra]